MIEKNHGHVVALSSMAGIIGLENLVPYCATKFAVRGKNDKKSLYIIVRNEQKKSVSTLCE